MSSVLERLLDRLDNNAPRAVREHVVPVLRLRVIPVINHLAGPVFKLAIAYVLLQIFFSQSSSMRTTWARVKAAMPRPVHRLATTAGGTWMGRATLDATFTIRNTADRVFHPLHAIHARQQERGQEAGEGIMNIQNAIDEVRSGVPRVPSVDEQMQRIEAERPPPPPDR